MKLLHCFLLFVRQNQEKIKLTLKYLLFGVNVLVIKKIVEVNKQRNFKFDLNEVVELCKVDNGQR